MHVYKNKIFVYCIMSVDGDMMEIFNLLKQQDEVMVALNEYLQNFIAQKKDILDKMQKASQINDQDSERINHLNNLLNTQLDKIIERIENEQMLIRETQNKIAALNQRLAAAVSSQSQSTGGNRKYKKRATKKRNRKYKRKSNKRL